MNIIFCFKQRGKGKVYLCGNTISLLTMVVAISRTLAEKVSKEKGLVLDRSVEFITESIKDGLMQ